MINELIEKMLFAPIGTQVIAYGTELKEASNHVYIDAGSVIDMIDDRIRDIEYAESIGREDRAKLDTLEGLRKQIRQKMKQ